MVAIELVCIECGGALARGAETLACMSCGRVWPVREGIPVFLRGEVEYWGELPRAAMAEMLAVGRERGWREAVFNYLMPCHPFVYRYACDPRRGDFRFRLPPGGRALDLGAGLGRISRCLAEDHDEVVAIDPVFERAAFLEMIRAQEGIDNLSVLCGGERIAYPFPDASFDLVVVSGVLEWVGQFERTLPPREAQARFLERVVSMLRPGGALYLAIENRFGFQYLLGVRDHNGLFGTNLLPRALADIVCRLRRGDRYRTLTHSRRGLRRLLAKTGFVDVRLHWADPDYREPRAIVPLDPPGALDRYVPVQMASGSRGERLQRRIAEALDLVDLLSRAVTAFAVTARRPGRGAGPERGPAGGPGAGPGAGMEGEICIERLLREIAGDGSRPRDFIQFVRNPAAHGKAIFVVPADRARGRALLVKVARGPSALPFLRNAADTIERVRARLPDPWKGSLPRILASGTFAGRHAVVEEYVRGSPLAGCSSARRLETGLGWLSALCGATAREVAVDDAVMKEGLLAPFRAYAGRFGAEEDVAPAIAHISTRCTGRTISLVTRHGDFWPGNVLRGGAGPVVIDWDFARPDALPFFDYYYYLGTNRWLDTGGTFADAFRDLPERFRARIRADLAGPFGRLGFVPDDADILYLFFLVEASLQQHDRLREDEANGFLLLSPDLAAGDADYREKMVGEFFRCLARERLAEF